MLKTERLRRGAPWRSTVSDQREQEEKVSAVVVGSLREEIRWRRLFVRATEATKRTSGALVVPRALLGRKSTSLLHKVMEMFLCKGRKTLPKKNHSLF